MAIVESLLHCPPLNNFEGEGLPDQVDRTNFNLSQEQTAKCLCIVYVVLCSIMLLIKPEDRQRHARLSPIIPNLTTKEAFMWNQLVNLLRARNQAPL